MNSQCREPHVLLPTRKCVIPQRFLFFDCEAYCETEQSYKRCIAHRFRLGCYAFVTMQGGEIQAREQGTMATQGAFKSVLARYLSSKQTLWVVAHNIGYDLTLADFWRMVADGFGRITDYCIDDPPVIVNWRHACGRCKFLDARNYWNVGIDRIAESTGVALPNRPDMVAGSEDWEDYCSAHVRAVESAVCRLVGIVEKENLGSMAATASGQAWNAYRYRFLARPIYIHADGQATDLERAGYFGGRADCFRVGSVPSGVCVYDTNSLYPACMLSEPSPYRLLGRNESCSVHDLWRLCQDNFCVAKIGIASSTQEYPVKSADGTVYATGQFVTMLCGRELLLALGRNEVTSVGPHAWYSQDFLFGEFVEHFYAKKLECRRSGDLCGELVHKSILNSLYGKWGQRSSVWVTDHREPADQAFGMWRRWTLNANFPYICRAVCGAVQRLDGQAEWLHSFPAISAGITSAGRSLMDEYRAKAGASEVYYQDTDSLHVSSEGEKRLIRGNCIHKSAIGKLRREGTHAYATYRGLKNYSLGEERTIAGVKAYATAVADGTFLQDNIQGLRSVLNSCPNGKVLSKIVSVRCPGVESRRIVDADGWTRPIKLLAGETMVATPAACKAAGTPRSASPTPLFDTVRMQLEAPECTPSSAVSSEAGET